MLSQCPQDATQLPQSSLLALSLLRSYKELTVGPELRHHYLPVEAVTFPPPSPLLSPTQSLPSSAPRTRSHPFISPTCNPTQLPPVLSPLQDPFCWPWYRAHHRKNRTSQSPPIHRLGAPTAYPTGAPKQSGTCASSFSSSSSASPPSRQPLSCCLTWQPHTSIIQV